jgi:FKBP-type peptidyl-prolyl cis-trans isomerase SlpA
MTIAIGPGTAVTLHFALLMEDGSEVDSTFERSPASFVFGDGNLLPGVEAKLQGLTAGQQATLTLAPEDAFGQRNPANSQRMPRSQFADIELSEGLVLNFADAANTELPGVVSAIDDEQVEIDFNHPLAGQQLGFRVEILDVQVHAGDEEAGAE